MFRKKPLLQAKKPYTAKERKQIVEWAKMMTGQKELSEELKQQLPARRWGLARTNAANPPISAYAVTATLVAPAVKCK